MGPPSVGPSVVAGAGASSRIRASVEGPGVVAGPGVVGSRWSSVIVSSLKGTSVPKIGRMQPRRCHTGYGRAMAIVDARAYPAPALDNDALLAAIRELAARDADLAGIVDRH